MNHDARLMNYDARFWDKLADKYSRKPVDDPEAFERKIAITRSKMTPDSVVLDIRCGTGSLALRLADAGAHVHGLDLSPEMIRIAREKAEASGTNNVTFHVGPFDSSFTPLGEGSLDGLCAYSILHLIAERTEALARIRSLIKPGGFFISSTVCLGETWVPFVPILSVMKALGKAPLVKSFSKAQLIAEMEAAGFVNVTDTDVGAKPTIAFLVARVPE